MNVFEVSSLPICYAVPTGKHFLTLLHLQGKTVEALETTYQSTRRNITKQLSLQKHSWEKLKSRFNSFLRCPVKLPSGRSKQVGLTVCELSQRINKRKHHKSVYSYNRTDMSAKWNGMDVVKFCVWALWIHALQESRIRRHYGSQHFTVLCSSRLITTDDRKVVGSGKVLKLLLTIYYLFKMSWKSLSFS
jgi:hypothetical protein